MQIKKYVPLSHKVDFNLIKIAFPWGWTEPSEPDAMPISVELKKKLENATQLKMANRIVSVVSVSLLIQIQSLL